MALRFNPPEELIREYMNRPNPGLQVVDAAQQAMQTYVQQKALEQQQALAQQSKDATMAQGIAENGADYIKALDAIQARRNAPTYPIAQKPSWWDKSRAVLGLAPVGKDPNQESTGPNPYSSMPGMSPSMGQAQPGTKPTPPAMGSNPLYQEYQNDPSAFLAQHGPKGVARMNTLLDTEKKMQERQGKTPLTAEQYSALQSGKPEDLAKVFTNPTNGKVEIPPEYVGPSLSATSRNVWIGMGPTGTPIKVPKAGGPAEVVNVPGVGNQANPLQSKLNPNEYKDWVQEVNQFDADSVVKADRNILANLNQIATEISKYNPAMTGPLKSQQARAIAREVGALTDSDVARQALDPSVIGRLKSWASIAATGEIPKDQLELLRQTVETIKGSASGRISSVAQERASRKSKLYGGKVSPEELMGSLNMPTQFSVPGQNNPITRPDEEEAYQAWKASQVSR